MAALGIGGVYIYIYEPWISAASSQPAYPRGKSSQRPQTPYVPLRRDSAGERVACCSRGKC